MGTASVAFEALKTGNVGGGSTGSVLQRSLSALRDLINRVDDLFRPFEQRSADRTGLGLGLAMCRWGTEVNGGLISGNLPEHGCVFTVALPRV